MHNYAPSTLTPPSRTSVRTKKRIISSSQSEARVVTITKRITMESLEPLRDSVCRGIPQMWIIINSKMDYRTFKSITIKRIPNKFTIYSSPLVVRWSLLLFFNLHRPTSVAQKLLYRYLALNPTMVCKQIQMEYTLTKKLFRKTISASKIFKDSQVSIKINTWRIHIFRNNRRKIILLKTTTQETHSTTIQRIYVPLSATSLWLRSSFRCI